MPPPLYWYYLFLPLLLPPLNRALSSHHPLLAFYSYWRLEDRRPLEKFGQVHLFKIAEFRCRNTVSAVLAAARICSCTLANASLWDWKLYHWQDHSFFTHPPTHSFSQCLVQPPGTSILVYPAAFPNALVLQRLIFHPRREFQTRRVPFEGSRAPDTNPRNLIV